MAEIKIVIVPLNRKTYLMWKVQCQMALMKYSLQDIVSGTKEAPGKENADARRKCMARRDRILAIIVVAINLPLLYLLGDPEDPNSVWKKLEEQFQPKTWSNKLQL